MRTHLTGIEAPYEGCAQDIADHLNDEFEKAGLCQLAARPVLCPALFDQWRIGIDWYAEELPGEAVAIIDEVAAQWEAATAGQCRRLPSDEYSRLMAACSAA